jgi:hypothetical protein
MEATFKKKDKYHMFSLTNGRGKGLYGRREETGKNKHGEKEGNGCVTMIVGHYTY